MKYSLLKLLAVFAAIMNPAFAAFHKDALVTTPDGNLLMSQLKAGHQVRSFSPRSEAMGNAMVVTKSLGEQSESIVEIDLGERKIRAMPSQRLFDVASQGWVRAKNLTPDHVLLGEDGSLLNILNVEKQRRVSFSLLHEVTVNQKHNLFVDGVLNHNMLGHLATALDWVGRAFIAEQVYEKTAPVREKVNERLHVKQEQREVRADRAAEIRNARVLEGKKLTNLVVPKSSAQLVSVSSYDCREDLIISPTIEIDQVSASKVAPQIHSNIESTKSLRNSLRREVTSNPNRDSGPIPTRLPNYNPHGRGVGRVGPYDPDSESARIHREQAIQKEAENQCYREYWDEETGQYHSESMNPGGQDIFIYGFLPQRPMAKKQPGEQKAAEERDEAVKQVAKSGIFDVPNEAHAIFNPPAAVASVSAAGPVPECKKHSSRSLLPSAADKITPLANEVVTGYGLRLVEHAADATWKGISGKNAEEADEKQKFWSRQQALDAERAATQSELELKHADKIMMHNEKMAIQERVLRQEEEKERKSLLIVKAKRKKAAQVISDNIAESKAEQEHRHNQLIRSESHQKSEEARKDASAQLAALNEAYSKK